MRGPPAMRADVVQFAFEFLDDWLAAHGPLDEEGRAEATVLIPAMYDVTSKLPGDEVEAGQLDLIARLRDRLLSKI